MTQDIQEGSFVEVLSHDNIKGYSHKRIANRIPVSVLLGSKKYIKGALVYGFVKDIRVISPPSEMIKSFLKALDIEFESRRWNGPPLVK